MKTINSTLLILFFLVFSIPILSFAQQEKTLNRNSIDISYVFYKFPYIDDYESGINVNYLSKVSYAITYQRRYMKHHLVSKHSLAFYNRDSYFGKPVPWHQPYFQSQAIILNNAVVYEMPLSKKLFIQAGGNIEFRSVYEQGNNELDVELLPRTTNVIGFGPELGIRYNVFSRISIFADYCIIRNYYFSSGDYLTNYSYLFHSALKAGIGFNF